MMNRTAFDPSTYEIDGDSEGRDDDVYETIERLQILPAITRLELRNLAFTEGMVRSLIMAITLKPHKSGSRWKSLCFSSCANNRHLSRLLSHLEEHQTFQVVEFRNSRFMRSRLMMPMPSFKLYDGLKSLALVNVYLTMQQALGLREALESTSTLQELKIDRIMFLEQYAACQIAEGIARNKSLLKLEYVWRDRVEAYLVINSATFNHPTLREVKFGGDTVPEGVCDAVAIGRCHSLESLQLKSLGSIELSPLISTSSTMSRNLKELDLGGNTFHNFQIDELFASLEYFPNLTDLGLSQVTLSDFGGSLLYGNGVLSSSMKRLDLSRNEIEDHVADEFLVNLWKFPNLVSLDLSYNRLTSLEFRGFLDDPRCYALQELQLFHPHFSWLLVEDSHIFWLEKLVRRTSLKVGSRWACRDIRLQCLLDSQHFKIGDAEATPPGLWPHVMSQVGIQLTDVGSRSPTVLFHLIRDQAIHAIASSSCRRVEVPIESDFSAHKDRTEYSATVESKTGEEKWDTDGGDIGTMEDTVGTRELSSEFFTFTSIRATTTNDETRDSARNVARQAPRRFQRIVRFFSSQGRTTES